MDGSQFDRMTRDLAKGTSRRTLVKSLIGIGGALIAGNRLGLDRAEAARRGFPGPTLPGNLPMPPICPDCQAWNGATCVCASGIACDTGCCGEGTVCVDGSCVTPPPTCADGQSWNGSACECAVGLTCGSVCCADGTMCSSGACIPNPGCLALEQPCIQPTDCCSNYCANSVCRSIPHGGGCFVGETRIAKADGTSRPVAEIAEGDFVLGDGGRVNRVLGIDRLTLDNRLLYGLNGSQPFVTASHPFMTEDGWKAIDPEDSDLRTAKLPAEACCYCVCDSKRRDNRLSSSRRFSPARYQLRFAIRGHPASPCLYQPGTPVAPCEPPPVAISVGSRGSQRPSTASILTLPIGRLVGSGRQ